MITFEDRGDHLRIKSDGWRVGICPKEPSDHFAITRWGISRDIVKEIHELLCERWGKSEHEIKWPILPVDPARLPEEWVEEYEDDEDEGEDDE